MTSIQTSKLPLDELPKQFVAAMRTLFDIMDDKKTGYVKFIDIQSRWQEDETKGLPKGVVESLRKVTPPNGLLSFDRFCAGLKICLLRNKSESVPKFHSSNTNLPVSSMTQLVDIKPVKQMAKSVTFTQMPQQQAVVRPQSVPADRLLLDRVISEDKHLQSPQRSVHHVPNAHSTAIKPSLTLSRNRTVSMPHLGSKQLTERPNRTGLSVIQGQQKIFVPKPKQNTTTASRSEILTTLHNWHMGLKANSESNLKRLEKLHQTRPPAEGKAMGTELYGGIASDVEESSPNLGLNKKSINRRREPRRHTLASGIDYNMLKRMKQLEQEKDVLLQGLEAVDKAHDWYLKQISGVQEKMKFIGKSTSRIEYSTEAHQEKLSFQMARIFEVNQHLSALVETSERGFPLHMNLAVPYRMHQRSEHDDNTIKRLKEQNHLLTEEVGRKSERITQLEGEKSALIRELFQARTQNRREVDDTTFL